MKLFNTLSKEVEEFKPIDGNEVKLYSCGPTVYDFPHIGNLRTYLLTDLLIRVLKFNGYKVNAVQNITDIEDKIIKKSKEEEVTTKEITDKYTDLFLEDIKKINIKTISNMPRATDYIKKIIEFVQVLVRSEIAYVETDGSVYFDVSKWPEYGKLSGIDKIELKTGTRTLSDEYEKDNPQDFALWKASKEDEPGFNSPWGKGRPGWHIECSVMAQELLGDQIDLHIGGVDLIFPHHENEIAQTEARTGKKPFVKFWVHGGHLLVEGQKMSKSLNNFYTLSDLEQKSYDPLSLRYLYMQTHYRQEMNFTSDSLDAAQNALSRILKEVSNWEKPTEVIKEYVEKFSEALNNDLNFPRALSVLWEVIKSDYDSGKKHQTLLTFDRVLALDIQKAKVKQIRSFEVPDEVKQLAREREKLRKTGRYHLADEFRHKIKRLGFDVEDSKDGTKIFPIR